MPGEVRFTPTQNDYVAAPRLHYRKQVLARKFWGRLTLVTFGIAIASALALSIFGVEFLEVVPIALFGATGGGIGLLIIVVGNYLLLPRRSRRLFRQQRSLHRETTFAWDAISGCWSSDNGNSRTKWSDYHAWAEGSATILLYLNDQLFQFLPLRVFAQDQLEDLRATLCAAGVPPK